MNRDSWDEICELLMAALNLDGSARDDFLNERCGDDQQKKEEVLSLIRNHEEAETFLDSGAVNTVARSPEPGLRIGPFRVVRQLGEGGMGAVFLAERADSSFEHRVAIKLLRAGATHGDLVDRFRRERQILANLDHPHIAKLLDGGSTEDGLPYIVMEHVEEGIPIDLYCRQHRLDTAARVRLFLKVCDAVQFAHRNLVIHRDLKPGNILVTPKGEPKLLDFGIAKILRSDTWPDLGAPTRTGVMPMTPAYASPEQVSASPLSTASDVYSLGVLLYELLCEHRPYNFGNDQLPQIVQAICHDEPPAPSAAILRNLKTVDGTSNKSEVKGRQSVAKQLEGDLDSIVMMALRKEPDRRYGSAGGLAEDLERYLEGHPVRARADTLSYRTTKFVARHRWPIAGVALVVLLLVGAFVLVVLEQEQTLRERDRARAAVDLLLQVFETPDPSRAKGRTITARELLDRGARSSEERLEDQPELLAYFRGIIGRTYAGLGLQTEAVERLSASLELSESQGLGQSAEAAETRSYLGKLLADVGDYAEAERLTRKALLDLTELFGKSDKRAVETLVHLGDIQRITGRYADARDTFDSALVLTDGLVEPSVMAKVQMQYAVLETRTGNHARAEELSQWAVGLLEDTHGPIHPEVARAYNNLAQSQWERKPEIAEDHIRHALGIQGELHEGDHPSKVVTQNNLGLLLIRRGRHEEAERILLDNLDMTLRVHGRQHAWYGLGQKHLASIRRVQNRLEDAELLLRSALDILRSELGDHHPDSAGCANELARLLKATGRNQEARTLYESALAALRESVGSNHPWVPRLLNNLSTLAFQEKRFQEARNLAVEAISLVEQRPEAHTDQCELLLSGALTESKLDHLGAAIVYGKRAVPLCERDMGPSHPVVLRYRTRILRWQLELEQYEGCAPTGRDLVELWQETEPEGSFLAQSKRLLGTCLMRIGRGEEAEPYLLSGLEWAERKYAADDPRMERALKLLVELYEDSDPAAAEPYRQRIEAFQSSRAQDLPSQ